MTIQNWLSSGGEKSSILLKHTLWINKLYFFLKASRPKNSSPNRSLAPPIEPIKRNVSPLRNIEVPQSSLLPVKEETEISSHSDADIFSKIKNENNNNEVNWSKKFFYFS